MSKNGLYYDSHPVALILADVEHDLEGGSVTVEQKPLPVAIVVPPKKKRWWRR